MSINLEVNNNYQKYSSNNKKNNQYKQQTFGSGLNLVTESFRYLNINPAVGASLVDLGAMALPRTIVDSQRGLDAGLETGIRESSGTVNHALIGAVGGLSAIALSGKFNSLYGTKAQAIFANNETIDALGSIWNKHFSQKNTNVDRQREFYTEIFENLVGLNPQHAQANGGWVGIPADTRKKLVDAMVECSTSVKDGKRLPKDKMNYLRNLIISSTGAENNFKLLLTKDAVFTKTGKVSAKIVEKELTSLSVNTFLDDAFTLARAFSRDNVTKIFEQTSDISKNTFIKELKGLKMRSAVLALAISSIMGASVQPFNRWLTKVRTGKDGFVGVSDNPNANSEKPTTSSSFMLAKLGAAAGIMGLALRSIGKFSEIPGKVQFKGPIPTIPQFKLVYGLTIASRFLASRDSNELRESMFKDILGFTNWLILGGFVSKAVITLLDKNKELLNVDTSQGEKGLGTWLNRTSIKSVDEVVQGDLAPYCKTVTDNGEAIPFKQLMKKVNELGLKATKSKILKINIAQAAGYIYSGVVLGVLIPKLNILMTKNMNKTNSANNQVKQSGPNIAFLQLPSNDNSVFAKFLN